MRQGVVPLWLCRFEGASDRKVVLRHLPRQHEEPQVEKMWGSVALNRQQPLKYARAKVSIALFVSLQLLPFFSKQSNNKNLQKKNDHRGFIFRVVVSKRGSMVMVVVLQFLGRAATFQGLLQGFKLLLKFVNPGLQFRLRQC